MTAAKSEGSVPLRARIARTRSSDRLRLTTSLMSWRIASFRGIPISAACTVSIAFQFFSSNTSGERSAGSGSM